MRSIGAVPVLLYIKNIYEYIWSSPIVRRFQESSRNNIRYTKDDQSLRDTETQIVTVLNPIALVRMRFYSNCPSITLSVTNFIILL